MIDLILFVIILILLGGFGWYAREQERVKTKLINAILAKDSTEYVNRTLADKTELIVPQVADKDPDLIAMDQINDEQFDAMIQSTLENEVAEQEIT